MALPPIVFTSQHVTIYSPRDSAIDIEKTGEEAWRRYRTCEELDVGPLVMRPGDKPVEFTIRALSPAENDIIGGLVYGSDDSDPGSAHESATVQTISVMLHAVRFGLIETDLEGWNEGAKRSRVNASGGEAWDERSIAAIDGETRLFLGQAILSLSRLDQKKTSDLASRAPIEMEPRRKKQRRKARSEAV